MVKKNTKFIFLFLLVLVLVYMVVRSSVYNKIYNVSDGSIEFKRFGTFVSKENPDFSLASNYDIYLSPGEEFESGYLILNDSDEFYDMVYEEVDNFILIENDARVDVDIIPEIEILEIDTVINPKDIGVLRFKIVLPENIKNGTYSLTSRFILPNKGVELVSNIVTRYAIAVKYNVHVLEDASLYQFLDVYNNFDYFLVFNVLYRYLPMFFGGISFFFLFLFFMLKLKK